MIDSIKAVVLSMLTAASYAVFLHNLIFAGGLGATEVIKTARRNAEIGLTALFVGLFSAAAAALCRLFTLAVPGVTESYALLCLAYGGLLLGLYLFVCGAVALLPIPMKRLILKRIGMGALNTLVMSVPLLMFRLGASLPQAIGLGLGAGLAFLIASLLINSGLYILQQNKAIPPMFAGVPAALIYTGLLALAFTGFTGEVLFQ